MGLSACLGMVLRFHEVTSTDEAANYMGASFRKGARQFLAELLIQLAQTGTRKHLQDTLLRNTTPHWLFINKAQAMNSCLILLYSRMALLLERGKAGS